MAKAPKTIDPTKTYVVQVSRAVRIGKAQTTPLTPRHEITLLGALLLTIPADAILSVQEA